MKSDSLITQLNELLSSDYSESWGRIGEVMLDPASDITLAVTLAAIVSLLVTLVSVGIIVMLMGPSDEESAQELPALSTDASVERVVVHSVTEPPRARSSGGLTGLLTFLVCLLLVWIALGVGTSQDGTCLGCHADSTHGLAQGDSNTGSLPNAHESVTCVGCHEPSSFLGRYTTAIPSRSRHYLYGIGVGRLTEYGSITSNACVNCHSTIRKTVVENDDRGVRVSHAEPLAAGARCIDCHALRQGVVSSGPGGMTRCIRCHNGQEASADCDSCHFKDTSVAAVGVREIAPAPGGLIETPDCGGCHDLKRSCDPCHGGIRLPHSQQFIRGQHARPAVESYWYGDGKACEPCHTQTRRSCRTCHQGAFWSHRKSQAVEHQAADPNNNGCGACHSGTVGTLPGRNFCIDLCHTDREEWRK